MTSEGSCINGLILSLVLLGASETLRGSAQEEVSSLEAMHYQAQLTFGI